MPADLPDGWRDHFVEMVRGTRPLEDDWFTGGPALSAMEQIGVYRNQYRLRLYDAVKDEVPGLAHLLGDGAETTLRAYLYDHPSQTWTLNRIADQLVEWLQTRMAPARFVEMARLDRAVQRGFDAAPGSPIDPAELATMPPLALQPHVTLLRLTTNVHWIRSAVLAGKPDIPALAYGDYPVAVFRRGIKMRHWAMPLGAWLILDGVDRGLGVDAAIDHAFSLGALDMETLTDDIGTWFKDYSERSLVQVARG